MIINEEEYLPEDIIRMILEKYLKESPLSIFKFNNLFEIGGYSEKEKEILILKCIKENFEQTKNPLLCFEILNIFDIDKIFNILCIVQYLLVDEKIEWIATPESISNCIYGEENQEFESVFNLFNLQWIYSINPNAIKLCKKLCNYAIVFDDFEMLKWLCSVDCYQDKETLVIAVENRNLEMVKFLRSQNPPCPWGKECCLAAVINKDLEMLKFLRRGESRPCPWNMCSFTKIIFGINSKYNVIDWQEFNKHTNPTSLRKGPGIDNDILNFLFPCWFDEEKFFI